MTGTLSAWRHLGAILFGEGVLTAPQLREAFEEQERGGGRLGAIVVERGWATEEQVARALAKQYGLDYVEPTEEAVDPAFAVLLPREQAEAHRVLPLQRLEDGAVVAVVADPGDVEAIDLLRLLAGDDVRIAVAAEEDIALAIRRVHVREIELDHGELASSPDEVYHERIDVWEAATSAPAVRYVNQVIGKAIEERASDIHFLPQEDALHVRARVDGVMRDLGTIPRPLQAGVASRLKIMGSLDIAERRAPQDGRVFVRWNGQPIDLRIAVLPTTYGEHVVLRVLRRSAAQASLADLGMAPDVQAIFERAIAQPFGAVVVCGPTGSGKTTTLYSALELLRQPDRTLITIEDPVEYDLSGVAQVEVRAKAGLTFASGLRTILRSDPDVILVGEIRDRETAEIAIQAAMTGHLVLTSLHTQTAASSIERLKDMGIDPSLLAAALNCIVAQRLVRRLCLHCRQPYRLTPELQERLGLQLEEEKIAYRGGSGCVHCSRTGYRGRVALYEVMPIQGGVRRFVGSSTDEIYGAAAASGMRSLRSDGVRLALEGVTSFEEVARVTGDRMT